MSRGGLAVIALLAVLAAGCDSGGASTGTSTSTASSGRAPAISLRVTYYPHGSGRPARHWTLTCSPTGGNHPRRAQACAELDAHSRGLAPAQRACRFLAVRNASQSLVTGTQRGTAVRRLFWPACDPEWTSLHALLRGR